MDDRELVAIERSTPTYLFRITDAAGSGVDVTDMKVMMCLKIICLSGTYYRYVVSDIEQSQFSYIVDADPDLNEVWADVTYAKNLGNGLFSVTVPLWKWGKDIISMTYQVFIYGNRSVTGDNMVLNNDEATIIPGRIEHHNIMIDRGTILIESSMFPLTISSLIVKIKQATRYDDATITWIKNYYLAETSLQNVKSEEAITLAAATTLSDTPATSDDLLKMTHNSIKSTYAKQLELIVSVADKIGLKEVQ